MNDMNNGTPESNDQDTRVVPAVGKDTLQETQQRRRATRLEQAEEAVEKPVAQPAAEEISRVQTRVMPAADGQAAEKKSIPQPKALSRARQQEASAAPRTRSTVKAADYERAAPLGQPSGSTTVGKRVSAAVQRPAADHAGSDAPFADMAEDTSKKHHALPVIVAVVLVLALLVVGLLMIPGDAQGLPGNIKRAVTGMLGGAPQPTAAPAPIAASDFSGMPLQGAAPMEVIFTLTTGKHAQQVRVVNENGEPMNAETLLMTDNADTRVWSLRLMQAEAYTGNVQAQVSAGDTWQDTGCMQYLQVTGDAAPATEELVPDTAPTDAPTQEPVVTEAPTDAPVTPELPAIVEVDPTEAPTDIPTAEPTEEPTPVPVVTMALEATATPVINIPETDAPAAVLTAAPETETPEPAPTEEPIPTEEPAPQETATPTPAPTKRPALTASATEDTDPDKLLAASIVYNNAARKLNEYTREIGEQINMPAADAYLPRDIGVLTFRGSSFRQNAASGTVSGDLTGMSVKWQTPMGRAKASDGSFYYGAGYQSQPAIVKWSAEVRQLSNILDEKKAVSGLKEIILPGMDGKIYFLDLADGQETRKPVNLGFPMRCAPSVHPYSFPVMSVGQFARKMASGTGKIGLRFYDLLTQKEVYRLDGLDGNNDRIYYTVGSFETSSLIDGASDTMISLGTNGMLYLTHLNTEFSQTDGAISITPENVTMTSHGIKQKTKYAAVESSMAAYQNYVWYADMEGILRCVDTNTLTPVWAVNTGDSVEAAIALRLDDEGKLWLYTANELSIRSKGDCSISCYDALTGECRWTKDFPGVKGKKYITGAKASPVIGQNMLDGLVFFTLSGVRCDDHTADGLLCAMNAETGDVIWKHELQSYAYSSPVAVYSQSGDGWLVQADAKGNVELINAYTGEVISTLQLDGEIESSPAVYGDTLVIATTGNKCAIYGINLE